MRVRSVHGAVRPHFFDALLTCWVVGAQAFIVLIGVAFGLYLVVRPFVPGASSTTTSSGDLWAIISTWPELLGTTLIVCGTASVISLALALPIAYLLFRTNLPGRRAITAGLLLAACMPVFVGASSVIALMGLHLGSGNPWLAGVIHGWVAMPLSVLPIGLAYRCVDRAWIDAAAIEANWRYTWRHVEWPVIRWSVAAVVVLQFWLAGVDITVTDLLAVRTFAEEVYVGFQLGGSTALQSLVIAPYLALFGILLFELRRMTVSADLRWERITGAEPPATKLGTGRWPLLAAMFIVLTAIMGVPLLAVMRQVGSLSELPMMARSMTRELGDSLLLAGGTAIAVVILIMGIAPAIVSRRTIGRAQRAAILLLFALPTPCLAIMLIEMTDQPMAPLSWLYDSIALPILGQTLRWLPVAVLVMLPGLVRVTKQHIDAARLDGCRGVGLYRTLYWPACRPFLVLAALAAFVLTLGEVTLSVLLSPPDFLPLSVRFFTLAHYGLRGEAAVVVVLVVATVVLPWSLASQWLHRSVDHQSTPSRSAR